MAPEDGFGFCQDHKLRGQGYFWKIGKVVVILTELIEQITTFLLKRIKMI